MRKLRLASCSLRGSLHLAAQTSGQFEGTVSDQHGAVIPAPLSSSRMETAAGRKTSTLDNGGYRSCSCRQGHTAEVESGLPSSSTGSSTGQHAAEPGSEARDSVRWTKPSMSPPKRAAINTQNATIGNPFTETQIRQLPIQTRNVVDLLSLQPGVAPTGEVLGAEARSEQRHARWRRRERLAGSAILGWIPCSASRAARFVQEFRTTRCGAGRPIQGRSSGRQVAPCARRAARMTFMVRCMSSTGTSNGGRTDWFSNRAGIARENLCAISIGASVGGSYHPGPRLLLRQLGRTQGSYRRGHHVHGSVELFKQGIVQFR